MGKMVERVAIVTGGASGLGAEGARVLAREGAMVLITDTDASRGRDVAGAIPGCTFMEHDVRDEAGWARVVGAAKAMFGRIDTLVNNAGLIRFGAIDTASTDDWQLQIDVMLKGAFFGCRAVMPHLSRSGTGSIINIASVAGLKGFSALPGYCAAKAGLLGLTRSVAAHCREHGTRIRVNAIAPGAIVTPMTRFALDTLDKNDSNLDEINSHGMGQPIDVANMILYLASDDGRHLTGTTISIDNGETM